MENIKLSVVVPIYNLSECLVRCIDSILAQELESMEVILVNDGSTDESGNICDEKALADSRIKVIHKKNGGVNTARNAGLDLAKGEFVTLIDGDDHIQPETFRAALEFIEQNNNVDILQYPEIRVIRGKEMRAPNYPFDNVILTSYPTMINALIGQNPILPGSLCGKIYRRYLWADLRLREDMQFCEDMYILPDIMKRCRAIAITLGGAYYYVAREGSATHTKFTPKNCLDCFRFNATIYQASMESMINTEHWWNEACFAAIDAYAYWGPCDEIKSFLKYLQRTKKKKVSDDKSGKLTKIARVFSPLLVARLNRCRMLIKPIR